MSYTYNYPNNTVNITSGTGGGVYTITSPSSSWQTIESDVNAKTLKVNGDAEFTGDLTVKGKSIIEQLEKIEQRLAILHPNKKLEQKWERLKALGDMYRELEQEIIEKEQIWATLKK